MDRLFMTFAPGRNSGNNGRAFLLFALEQLLDLVEGAGWDNEYPRPVWQLRRLGYVPAAGIRNLNFADIGQPWLQACAKRWAHWRLTIDSKSVNTVAADLGALTRLSTYLTGTGQAQHTIRGLSRPVLEAHIAWLHTLGILGASAFRAAVSALAVFLRALQDHEDWAPDLPRNTIIYSSDYPRIDPLRSRGLSNHVMTQVRAHLPQWRNPDSRFLTYLMLGTGLRIGDACKLPFDPMVFDADNNPYVHYWNHKMRREAYVPISPAMLARITAQQAATTARFPDQVSAYLAVVKPRRLPHSDLQLTPAAQKNPHGLRPFGASVYNALGGPFCRLDKHQFEEGEVLGACGPNVLESFDRHVGTLLRPPRRSKPVVRTAPTGSGDGLGCGWRCSRRQRGESVRASCSALRTVSPISLSPHDSSRYAELGRNAGARPPEDSAVLRAPSAVGCPMCRARDTRTWWFAEQTILRRGSLSRLGSWPRTGVGPFTTPVRPFREPMTSASPRRLISDVWQHPVGHATPRGSLWRHPR